jgi:hypothetical protein
MATSSLGAEPARIDSRQRIGLADLRPGQTAVIHEASSDPADAAILRAMGLRRNARVRLCRRGEPCIVSVLAGQGNREGCRIGLARLLASRVVVQVV